MTVMTSVPPEFSVSALSPPTERCYWVVEGAFLAGAYPGSPDDAKHRRRIEVPWEAGLRTFITWHRLPAPASAEGASHAIGDWGS